MIAPRNPPVSISTASGLNTAAPPSVCCSAIVDNKFAIHM
jgi:hypothetical protein